MYIPLLATVFVAGQLASMPVHAATLGHSRLVSDVGEPLHITIPVTQMSDAERNSLRVVPAPASEWANAGLTPPVDLMTLQTRLTDGYVPGAHVLQVWSNDAFNQPIADLLLDIHTSSGVQRYQVSLLARGGATAIQAPSAQAGATVGGTATERAPSTVDQKPILVRRGDTMFAIAGRHSVSGVSVYQMMIALQRANPQAFIHDNINLVKAGEQLSMPDMAALTALSDREARRLFHEQVVAFNALRQGSGDVVAADPAAVQALTRSNDNVPSGDVASNIPQSRTAEGDQLRLSSGRVAAVANTPSGDGAVSDNAVPDNQASDRVTSDPEQPGQASTNSTVQGLAQNMASGMSKTAQAASATGIAGAVASTGTRSSTPSGNTEVLDEDATADDALAARKAIDDAEHRVSQLEENVKNLNQALQSQGEAAIDVVVDGALGLRQSLTDVATAVTDATIGDEEYLDNTTDSAQQDTTSTPGDVSVAQQDNATTSTMDSIINGLQANLIAVITGALALIVLIIAWVLRRANINQSRTDSAVTPEMVKEKLEQINLDLNEPTINDSTAPR